MTSELAVKLGEKSYPIHFADDTAAAIRELLAANVAGGRGNILMTDDGVARAQSRAY